MAARKTAKMRERYTSGVFHSSISSVGEGSRYRRYEITLQQLELLADIYHEPKSVISNALRVARSLRSKGLADIDERPIEGGKTMYVVGITELGRSVCKEKMRWGDEDSAKCS